MRADSRFTFYEFFAGGGMVRAGLGEDWDCLFANDMDPAKADAYAANYGTAGLHVGDIAEVTAEDLPGVADLAWASFPCQDLSLAGRRGGLSGARSSTVFALMDLINGARARGRAPALMSIENVTGLLSSAGGADFAALCEAFAKAGYRFGALEIDAAAFLPQSRPRLFVIAMDAGLTPPDALVGPGGAFTSARIAAAREALPVAVRAGWIDWRLPAPPARNIALHAIVDETAGGWFEASALIDLMDARNLERLQAARAEARASGEACVGAVYRRMRGENGARVQRAEARFDGLCGCLRTPGGGSSRQFLLFVQASGEVRARPMSPRETARAMGLEDDYVLPAGRTAALHLTGDGVAVDVVRWLARTLFEPLLSEARAPALSA